MSDNAIRALNKGAKLGGFYHNTGEGGISQFHKENGGDLVWNVGTGYFACRNKDGSFRYISLSLSLDASSLSLSFSSLFLSLCLSLPWN